MSSLPTSTERISTLVFRIPHISNFLIFKDILENDNALISVVTEFLKLGEPEVLYQGYDYAHSPRKEVIEKKGNAALIRIGVLGKSLVRRNSKRTIALLIKELQKPRNRVTLASNTLCFEQDIVAIAISIESEFHYNKTMRESRPEPVIGAI